MKNVATAHLLDDMTSVLNAAGSAVVSPSAYDTAWVARIPSDTSPAQSAYPEAIAWLAHHQLADGSWGEGGVPERLIATLAAAVALNEMGRYPGVAQQVERGVAFLWRMLPELHDRTALPVGFELLLSAMVAEGQHAGLRLPAGLVAHYEPYRQQKLQLLRQVAPERLRYTTALFNLEFLGKHLPDRPEAFVTNGCVGVSPAATASVARFVTDPQVRAEIAAYLESQRISDDHGAGWGSVTLFDTFEIVWVLYNLKLCHQLANPLLRPQVSRLIEHIQHRWTPGGLTFASLFGVADADLSTVGYVLLRDAGQPVDTAAIDGFWRGSHLATYEHERDLSISVNVHGLEAYTLAGRHDRVEQLLAFLDGSRAHMPCWSDKWHGSHYYTTGHAVVATAALDSDLAGPAVDWMLQTQHEDGGWGNPRSSAEESAYVLQALITYAAATGWDAQLRRAVQAGAGFVRSVYTTGDISGPPLWVSKNLYKPKLIIRSAVLSALLLCEAYGM